MTDLHQETEFFHSIAKDVIDLVQNSSKNMAIAEDKGGGDYSTQVDVDAEDLIVAGINKRFPDDQVLAEESHSDTLIPDGRIWIIDPICGTNNLGKGLNVFCTNIALADCGKVIASCVVDHSQGEYFWSVGNNEVYVNDKIYQAPDQKLGQKIDVDLSSVRDAGPDLQLKYNNFLSKLVRETDYDIISLNTSLGFAYAATGKMDGFINIFSHAWDIAASSFLIQQAGGIITKLDGSPWTFDSAEVIAGRTPEIHKELLALFSSS